MKSMILLSALMFSTSTFAFPFVYDCLGESGFEVVLTVKSKSKVIVANETDKDELKVNLAFMRANPEKKSVRLDGASPVLGYGDEGYTVNQTMSKIMLEGSKFGYLNTYAYGADGATGDTFKCKLR